jgi:hypothetical protein
MLYDPRLMLHYMLNMTINTVGTLNLSTEFGALFVFSAFIETLDFFFKKCVLRSPCWMQSSLRLFTFYTIHSLMHVFSHPLFKVSFVSCWNAATIQDAWMGLIVDNFIYISTSLAAYSWSLRWELNCIVTRETIRYTMKTKYRKTLQLYIKIPIIKYIVYVLYKIKSSQNTLDRNTPPSIHRSVYIFVLL